MKSTDSTTKNTLVSNEQTVNGQEGQKGENNMKNTIKMNRENEINAKKAAEAAAAKEAALKDVKPLNIVELVKQQEEKKANARVLCDKEGNPIAVCVGKYLYEVYKGDVIGAKTEEELNVIKGRIDRGIHGDNLLHKKVTINGRVVPCVGMNEKEIEKEVEALEVYSKENPTEPDRNFKVAVMLHEAGYKSENLEQVTVQNKDYLLVYEDGDGLKNYVMDLEGTTVTNKDNKPVNLADIEDELGRKSVKILLMERLEKAVASRRVEPRPTPIQTAPETPKAPRKPRTRKTTVEIQVMTAGCPVAAGCCGILISKQLKSYSLREVIAHFLKFQGWRNAADNSDSKGCSWIGKAYRSGYCTTEATGSLYNNTVIPTAVFIEERIIQDSPIYANSIQELTKKVADICYAALKDEPYCGMQASTGYELANYMAEEIVAQSVILTR